MRVPSLLWLLLAAPAVQAGQLAFQGLEWGASEQQIVDRFPGQTRAADCSDSQRTASERAGLACDGPVVAPYTVAGIPFRLIFTLTHDDRLLDGVTLQYEGDANESGDQRWSERHQKLRDALIDRYGPAERQNAYTEGSTLRATASWRESGTVIELQSSYLRPGAGPGRERYQISYRARHRGDAGKL